MFKSKSTDNSVTASNENWVVFNSISDLAMIVDSNFRIIRVNPTVMKTTNLPEKRLIGQFCFEIFHGLKHPPKGCPHVKMLQSQHPETTDMPVKAINRTLLVTVAPIFDDHGRLVQTLHLAKDITERKKNEEIRNNQIRLLTLSSDVGKALTTVASHKKMLKKCCEAVVQNLDSAFARIWTLNTKDNMLELQASAGIYTHTDGAHSRVPIGTHKIGIIARDKRPLLTNNVLSDPQIHDHEWAKRKNIISFAGCPMLVGGKLTGVIGLFSRHPVSNSTMKALSSVVDEIAVGIERKRMEKDLFESQEILENIFSATHFIFALLDYKFNYIRVNRAYANYCDYEPDFFPGKNHFELFPSEEYTAIFRWVRESGEPFTGFSMPVCLPDQPGGGETYWDGTLYPMKDSLGNVQRLMIALVEVTERINLEKMLRQSQKMEAVGTLAGGIAHDFNNILTAILGYTELARDSLPSESRLRSYLDQVHKASIRAKDLVQQILAFSRGSEQTKKPVLINAIIKEALQLIRASTPTSVEIRENISLEFGTVLADPTQIHQLLMNLCANAIQAMNEEGILEISLGTALIGEKDAMNEAKLAPGPYLKLAVSDTGAGMDTPTKHRIFEPFFTTKELGQGTGMGLSVVHGIVNNHKGMITVDSEIGAGTIFNVFFPLYETAVMHKQETETTSPTGNERILLVDDEEVLANIEKSMLERLGYCVTAKTDSDDALETFKAKPEEFDLVITDQTMPKMTGDKLAKELMEIRPEIPIILCTGYSSKISKNKAKVLGIRKFIMKPVISRELAVSIREVLDGE